LAFGQPLEPERPAAIQAALAVRGQAGGVPIRGPVVGQ
jgi:hypothetical protein